ncbi:hypothetical protein DPMN_153652 [Dreissena polymorpha]|uniref:NTR domain-containing protein n=2 Tax=Dreissena polymorpha TaxID=45954 RepID=A0A9D4FQB4_DREPO|nr:hypothetical protein DPMN_153652 [Dreissena polymorpha]
MENCVQGPEVKNKDAINVGDSPSVRMEIELPFPLSSLPGTAKANAYIKSNLMGDPVSCVLEGVDKMFYEPHGCGEQNMIHTAPIVYGMYFLKQTGQMEEKHEDFGTRFMRNGITRQQSMYQKDDGSYAAFQARPSSLWLTAFVAKVFCQAENVVKGLANTDSLQKTLAYISKNNSVGSGHFQDDAPVLDRGMQGVLGQHDPKSDPSLTAFVLTSLQECKERKEDVQDSISRAMKALEGLPVKIINNNPYLLAISTYALALSNSAKANGFRRRLYDIRQNDSDRLYWSNSGAADSYSVETTAYALLAFLKFDDFKTSHKIVAWLTAQSDATGIWRSTQDTVVAMQALATYSARTYNPEVDLHVKIEKGDWIKKSHVNRENSLLHILIPNLPLKTGERKFYVTVNGRGSGVLKIDMFYNRRAEDDEICPFTISAIDVKPVNSDIANNPNKGVIKSRKCNVCGHECHEPIDIDYPTDMISLTRKKRQARPVQTCIEFSVKSKPSAKNSNDAGMSIVKVNLETGVKVVESDLKKMQKESVFPRYEMPKDGQGFVIIYLDNITSAETKLIFRLEDQFSGDDSSRQPATVKVYDYYKPERSCIKMYGIGSNHGHEIKYTCNDGGDQCQCMKSQCSKQVDQELFEMANKINSETDAVKRMKLRKPAEALMDYACKFDNANFVVKVSVTEKGYSSEREVMNASAVIEEAPLQGTRLMEKGDKMEFEWQVSCTQPKLIVGKTYYIIAKDGTSFTDKGVERVKYDLTGTALVIDPESKPLLRIVMAQFVKELTKNNGCTS